MKRTLAPLLASALVLAACGADPHPPDRAPAVGTPAATCDPALGKALSAWANAGFSGSIAISTAGAFDCLAAYGAANEATGTPNSVDTVYSIGSVSKAFTAAAVLDLVDAGELSLADRAGDVVPGLDGPVAEATVEQLLLHTSGLVGSHGRDHEPLGRAAAVAAIGELEQAFEPGSDHLYSNAGYTLLALIVEERSGTSYRDHMASRILRGGGFWDGEPAAPGPRAVGYLDDGPTEEMGAFAGPHWAVDGNGSLAMTMRDLASWTHALFTGEVVSAESVEVIDGPGVDVGDGRSETSGWVAFDASAHGEPFLTSAGGGGDVGHNAVVVWLPKGERVIAIASNTPDVTAEELLQAVGPALAAGEPPPLPEGAAGEVDPADLAAVAGTYALDTGGSFELSVRDDRLAIAAGGPDAVAALFPLHGGFTAGGVAAHEDAVSALLAGRTEEGRKERAAVESGIGAIDDVELVGTIVEDGELRTYVALASGTERIAAWYALDEQGGIAAAQLEPEPPSLLLVPAGAGRFRPDAPTGTGPDVTVAFEGDRMTVSGPAGRTGARRAG